MLKMHKLCIIGPNFILFIFWGKGGQNFFLKWQVEMENQKNEGWRWMTKKWGDGDGRPKNWGGEGGSSANLLPGCFWHTP